MQAAGLQCLELQTAAAPPDPQARAFPGPGKLGHPSPAIPAGRPRPEPDEAGPRGRTEEELHGGRGGAARRAPASAGPGGLRPGARLR